MTLPDLTSLFNPRHVALLGVSRSPHRDSNAYLRVLVDEGFTGRISVLGAADYGQAEKIESVSDLAEDVDVVFNMLRPALAEETLVEAAKRGAKFGVLFAGGFAESGEEGAQAQERLVRACAEHGMRIVGPNCMGFLNTWANTNLSEIDRVPRGRIGLVSQSGNNGITLVHDARKYGTGLSSFVSFGNQADIPAHAYVRHMGDDPDTHVIALYLEGLRPGDAEAFIETCREVSAHTPIVALKGGRGSAGSRAAASHTASLARVPRAYSALFRQAGIIEVESLEHLFPVAQALVDCPPLTGDRISVVGSGGGHSTVAADAIESVGLAVPEYSPGLQRTIAERLPFGSPVSNPVDMTGAFLTDATLFATIAEDTLEQDGFDGVVCYGLYGPEHWAATIPDPELPPTEAGPALAALRDRTGAPVLFFTIFADQDHPHVVELRRAGIPTFPDMGAVSAALAALRQRGRALANDCAPRPGVDCRAVTEAPETPQPSRGRVLDEHASLTLLMEAGVPVPEQRRASTPEAVAEAVRDLGRPAVVKGVLPGVAHKSELGAVKLGIADPEAGAAAAREIERSVAEAGGGITLDGFLVTEDLGRRRELIVGARRDPVLGSIALLGLGGVYAEQLDDVGLGILPLTADDIDRMIASLAAPDYFGSGRGEEGVDRRSLSELLGRLNDVLAAREEIESIDLNPVIVRPDGTLAAVDAAIHLEEEL